MDQESLRLLIRRKIQDGRLPHDGLRRIWSSPSDGETCDGCDTVLTRDQSLMEGITLDLGRRALQLHVRCFQMWEHERRAAGLVRKTGLPKIFGRHVAFFYDGKDDLVEICVPFLRTGLESNEVCVWVIAEPLTEGDAWAALGNAVALDRHRADHRIEILRSQTWYVTGDSPDLQKVARGWEAKLADALGRGYEGLRIAASAPQLEEKHWAEFFDYEDRLNRYLSDKAMLVLCAYPLAVPRAGDVMRTHPSTFRKRGGEWEVH